MGANAGMMGAANPYGGDPYATAAALGNQYAGSYDSALAMNEALYGDILQGYQQTSGNQFANQQGIQAGYGQLDQNVMNTLGLGTPGSWGVAAPAAQAIGDVYASQSSGLAEQLINSGLGNSTILGQMERGPALDASKAYGALGAQLAETAAGYQSNLGLAGLNYANQANMQNTAENNQQLNWMNSVSAPYPNASEYGNLMSGAGSWAMAQHQQAMQQQYLNALQQGGLGGQQGQGLGGGQGGQGLPGPGQGGGSVAGGLGGPAGGGGSPNGGGSSGGGPYGFGPGVNPNNSPSMTGNPQYSPMPSGNGFNSYGPDPNYPNGNPNAMPPQGQPVDPNTLPPAGPNYQPMGPPQPPPYQPQGPQNYTGPGGMYGPGSPYGNSPPAPNPPNSPYQPMGPPYTPGGNNEPLPPKPGMMPGSDPGQLGQQMQAQLHNHPFANGSLPPNNQPAFGAGPQASSGGRAGLSRPAPVQPTIHQPGMQPGMASGSGGNYPAGYMAPAYGGGMLNQMGGAPGQNGIYNPYAQQPGPSQNPQTAGVQGVGDPNQHFGPSASPAYANWMSQYQNLTQNNPGAAQGYFNAGPPPGSATPYDAHNPAAMANAFGTAAPGMNIPSNYAGMYGRM